MGREEAGCFPVDPRIVRLKGRVGDVADPGWAVQCTPGSDIIYILFPLCPPQSKEDRRDAYTRIKEESDG